jgi:hypothetical protein
MTIIPLHATGVSFSGFGATYQLHHEGQSLSYGANTQWTLS